MKSFNSFWIIDCEGRNGTRFESEYKRAIVLIPKIHTFKVKKYLKKKNFLLKKSSEFDG